MSQASNLKCKSERTTTRRSVLTVTGGGLVTATIAPTTVAAQENDPYLWRFDTGSTVGSSPTIANETVYVGDRYHNKLHAIDIYSGDQRWVFEATGDNGGVISATVDDGTVFFRSQDGYLYALDTKTGNQQWDFETGDQAGIDFASSPTVIGDTVFIGSPRTLSDKGTLHALDADTGSHQWSLDTNANILSSPTVANGTVFVGCDDGKIYSVDAATGDQQWESEIGSKVRVSPAVSNDIILIGSGGKLRALDTNSGDQQWSYDIELASPESSPVVASNSVFVVDRYGDLHSVDIETGQRQWVFEPVEGIGAVPTVSDGTVFLSGFPELSHVDDPPISLIAVNAESGNPQWTIINWGQVWGSPAVTNKTVFFANYYGSVYSFDLKTLKNEAKKSGSSNIIRGERFVRKNQKNMENNKKKNSTQQNKEQAGDDTIITLPGFGVTSSIAAITSAGYLIKSGWNSK